MATISSGFALECGCHLFFQLVCAHILAFTLLHLHGQPQFSLVRFWPLPLRAVVQVLEALSTAPLQPGTDKLPLCRGALFHAHDYLPCISTNVWLPWKLQPWLDFRGTFLWMVPDQSHAFRWPGGPYQSLCSLSMENVGFVEFCLCKYHIFVESCLAW